MKKVYAYPVLGFLLALMLAPIVAFAQDENGENGENGTEENCCLCHATESEENPFELLSLPPEAAEEHKNQHPGDIVPIEDRNGDGIVTIADCTFASGGQGGGPGGEGTPGPTNPLAAAPTTTAATTPKSTTVAATTPIEGFGGGVAALPETGGNLVGLLAILGVPGLVALTRKIRK